MLFLFGTGIVILSRAVSSQVPSALMSLTSVFGMRTGGTSSPSDELNFCVRYENRWDLIAIDTGIVERSTGGARLHIHNCIAESLLCITGFRLVVKLYLIEALGLLVSVSSTHYCAYTPDLSTLWSTRGLTQIALLGYLILRLVSRLDAFSVYPIRTSLPCCATGVTTDAP